MGEFASDPHARGESLVAALAVPSKDAVIAQGADRMPDAVDAHIRSAHNSDPTVAATRMNPNGGLGGAVVRAFDVTEEDLEGAHTCTAGCTAPGGPNVSARGDLVVSGLQLGNVWITVQPLLGVEGDLMRLLFERDLTPHRQHCAAYEWMKHDTHNGGIGAQAMIHLGMHGTVEWLPGLPLGNAVASWPDVLLGGLPNIYVYAANRICGRPFGPCAIVPVGPRMCRSFALLLLLMMVTAKVGRWRWMRSHPNGRTHGY